MAEIKAGDRVRAGCGSWRGAVLAIDGEEAWVRFDSGLRQTWSLRQLTPIPPEPKYSVGQRVRRLVWLGSGIVVAISPEKDSEGYWWYFIRHDEGWYDSCREIALRPACCK